MYSAVPSTSLALVSVIVMMSCSAEVTESGKVFCPDFVAVGLLSSDQWRSYQLEVSEEEWLMLLGGTRVAARRGLRSLMVSVLVLEYGLDSIVARHWHPGQAVLKAKCTFNIRTTQTWDDTWPFRHCLPGVQLRPNCPQIYDLVRVISTGAYKYAVAIARGIARSRA
jgi:hypothetical protein